ncbi:hypothetical protein FRC07_001719, partial [Ceratobasidium sp. 392]
MVAGTNQSTPAQPQGWTLSSILDNPDAFENEVLNGDSETVAEEQDEEKPVEEGYCIECEDQPANVRCETCEDDFCDVCFQAQHRKGTRKRHASRPLHELNDNLKPTSKTNGENGASEKPDDEMTDADTDADEDGDAAEAPTSVPAAQPYSPASLADRAKHIPLRLTLPERKLLRLLEAALHVSEYTDRVDILSYSSTRTKRAAAQIRELCSILSGLCLAADYKTGQELFQDRDFAANEKWFARVFEIGRRHKIMNPDKMRETYGKLIYLLMDAQTPDTQQLLGFSAVAPIVTVHSTLAQHDALAILDDPRLVTATREIPSPPNPTNRERAESLTLWREILGDMFRLWHLAETDLLAPHGTYRLRDTGQGLNRVQHAPKTSREMHAILGRAQRDIGSWVGSSVIHMGDHNVPNALLFIDKYSQIYRILLPISNVLAQIPAQHKVRKYADREFGSVDGAIREILTDFFKHAFDGSGADSYFDAGSCIDGRLTS